MKIQNFLERLSKIQWTLAYVPYVNSGHERSELPPMGIRELETARDEINAILVQLD